MELAKRRFVAKKQGIHWQIIPSGEAISPQSPSEKSSLFPSVSSLPLMREDTPFAIVGATGGFSRRTLRLYHLRPASQKSG
ncbi:MAG: hypothetical protein HQL56_01670 [Magnetococcales bacterium]|nr:hypothetical protein [Magnetococcales bacterium]